ncbi:MAG: esterase/lipase family protein, partial [Alphaproteobacteria bacterium]
MTHYKNKRLSLTRLLSLFCVLGLLLSLAAGCATPIGVTRGSTQDTYYALTANVLSAGKPSSWSTQVLHRANLTEKYEKDPEAALKEMRQALEVDEAPDRLFALSELSFYYAEQTGKNEYYLASAVYAYAFIFPEDGTPQPDPLDPRRRLAADLYNLGLVRGLDSPDREEVVLQAGKLALPFGELELSADQSSYLWGGFHFKRFIPVGDFEVRGFSDRYRQAGIGAPLAAELEPVGSGPQAEEARKRIPPRLKVPVTAFVQIAEPRRGIVTGKLNGKLEIYAADRTSTVDLNGRDVPLELEPTAVLAYMLEGSSLWDFEIAGFRFADPKQIFGDGLIMMHPYRQGRIPVVLVHGTASSPARWADMINELSQDPTIKGRYQFWLFQYNTGQPVLYSAMLLRRALKNIVKELDPKGEDPTLQRMVVIGHSQGGLLTKLMAVKSGNRFWENVSSEPFDEVDMPAETRELLREAMFFDPVPTVKRVIFIATPHRGSYQATGWVLNLVRRFINLPGTLVSQFQDLLKGEAFAQLGMSTLPTSVDNMSPGNPFLKALNDLKIDPGITAHSIIAVLGEGPLTGRTDGVVAYESAHIEGVASEKVVHSGHSTQGHPETIEEVKR